MGNKSLITIACVDGLWGDTDRRKCQGCYTIAHAYTLIDSVGLFVALCVVPAQRRSLHRTEERRRRGDRMQLRQHISSEYSEHDSPVNQAPYVTHTHILVPRV
jgi:hypothetical protein